MQGTNIISVQWNELRGGDARLSSACNVRARHRGLDCLTSMIELGKESVVADASAQYWLRDIAPGAARHGGQSRSPCAAADNAYTLHPAPRKSIFEN